MALALAFCSSDLTMTLPFMNPGGIFSNARKQFHLGIGPSAVGQYDSLNSCSGVKHLEALPEPVPAVNQIELHPWCQQRDIVAYCEKHGIVVEAYCPIVRADPKRMQDLVLVQITQKYAKEPAQVLLRWSLQKG